MIKKQTSVLLFGGMIMPVKGVFKLNSIVKIWISFTAVLSILGITMFWPKYVDNEFPLFSDIFMILVFLPSFFTLFFSILSFLINQWLIKKATLKFVINAILYCISFYTLYFIFKDIWSVNMRLISISLASLIGLIHYCISYGLLFTRSKR